MKKQNTQNGNALHSSSLRGVLATRQSNMSRLLHYVRNDREDGNALWFILIAILLLGLLTSMMTRSGSSTNDTGSYEQLSIQANEILQYAKSIENGVQSLLARGCSENEISFEANNNSGYTNPNSPTDNSCHVFEPEGAGLTYIDANPKWLDNSQSAQPYYQEWRFTGKNCINDLGNENCSTGTPKAYELMTIIPWLNIDTCLSINQILNHNFTAATLPQDDTSFSINYFTGTFPATGNRIGDTTGIQYITGRNSFCFEANSVEGVAGSEVGTYHFYHVLIAR